MQKEQGNLMKTVKFTGIFLLIAFCFVLFAAPAVQASSAVSSAEEQVFSYNPESSVADAETEEKTNIWGIVAWVVIGLGIAFILYVLLSAPKRRKGLSPSGIKYRRSPYKKRKKRIMEDEYYKYKRDKYKF